MCKLIVCLGAGIALSLSPGSASWALSPAPPANVRFDSVRVQDLSGRPLRTGRIDGRAAGIAPLRDSDAAAILAAPAIAEGDNGLSFLADLAASCVAANGSNDATCLQRFEQARIDGKAGVSRQGNRLLISPKTGVPLPFADFDQPESASADGDSSRHVYLGRVGSGRLHHVEIGFGHDSPGAFLINPDNGKTAFVHKGGDIAAVAPDGAHIVVFNTMNPPLSLAIASLDAAGPTLQLHCQAANDAKDRVTVFKGWHDAHSVDIVLRARDGVADAKDLPLRLLHSGAGWRLARTDPALPGSTLIGLACTSYPDRP